MLVRATELGLVDSAIIPLFFEIQFHDYVSVKGDPRLARRLM